VQEVFNELLDRDAIYASSFQASPFRNKSGLEVCERENFVYRAVQAPQAPALSIRGLF
jgi:hypothetical protein